VKIGRGFLGPARKRGGDSILRAQPDTIGGKDKHAISTTTGGSRACEYTSDLQGISKQAVKGKTGLRQTPNEESLRTLGFRAQLQQE